MGGVCKPWEFDLMKRTGEDFDILKAPREVGNLTQPSSCKKERTRE